MARIACQTHSFLNVFTTNIKFAPCRGIRKHFAWGFRNPGLWNPEYISNLLKIGVQNPNFTTWNSESKILGFLKSMKEIII